MSSFVLYRQIETFLQANCETGYRDFTKKLVPSTHLPILGVRLPVLQKFSKQIANSGDLELFLEQFLPHTFEETMLKGLVIAKSPLCVEKKIACFNAFLPLVDNWSVCDSVCAAWKDTKTQPQPILTQIEQWILSPMPYHQRFGIVLLLNYYISPVWTERVFSLLLCASSQDYYVKMAIAWAVSVCYLSFPQQTVDFLQQRVCDRFVFQKSIQKICESKQVSSAQKAQLRSLLSQLGNL